MTSKCAVVSWIRSYDTKRALMEKMVKSKKVYQLVNCTNVNYLVLTSVPQFGKKLTSGETE